MILLDLSQVMISNLMMHLATTGDKSQEVDESLVRHMIITSLLAYRRKHYSTYGDLIICCDDKNYWRRDIFPNYKANRKKDRDASNINWNSIFDAMFKIRDEIRDYLPYKVLQVERAEADDIIATMCHYYGSLDPKEMMCEPILILSGDKDFVQLQKYVNVQQYSPIMKKMMTTDNPERFLREHIMLGDKGDGVPNFLSDDDTFITNKRQRPVSRAKLEEWVLLQPEQFCDDRMLRGYKRNEQMVNLDLIPKELQAQIINQYESTHAAPKSGVLNYLISHRLRALTTQLGDF